MSSADVNVRQDRAGAPPEDRCVSFVFYIFSLLLYRQLPILPKPFKRLRNVHQEGCLRPGVGWRQRARKSGEDWEASRTGYITRIGTYSLTFGLWSNTERFIAVLATLALLQTQQYSLFNCQSSPLRSDMTPTSGVPAIQGDLKIMPRGSSSLCAPW